MKNFATESQTPKGTQYTGGWNFFVPDFNKLPYLFRSQGDKITLNHRQYVIRYSGPLCTILSGRLKRAFLYFCFSNGMVIEYTRGTLPKGT